ncbi:NRDE family protein [Halorubrum gandharaense]
MCTLTLAWRVFADAPVALAANRDEALGRPAELPALREPSDADAGDRDSDAPRRYVAPRDARAGGTWIGVNEDGLTVAVTNRWLDADREGDRSRGLLVADCLRAPTAEAAVRGVERELDERQYDGFNLVLADARAAFLLEYDGALSVTRLDPGVHVVGNVGGVINGRPRFSVPERRREIAEDRVETARRVAAAVHPEPGEDVDAWLDRASDLLADHDYGACIHENGFGTRSFTRIRTGASPAFAYADGPPCETAAEPVELPAGFAGDGE